MATDQESDAAGQEPIGAVGLFRRWTADSPIEPPQSRPASDVSAAADITAGPDDIGKASVDEAELAAASLVADGQAELMQARAEAARIQAEARERLVEVIRREQALAASEASVDDPGIRAMANARHEATAIVASARQTAIGLLEEAQHLLIAARLQASSSPDHGSGDVPSPAVPDSRTEAHDPAIVVDLTTDLRASRYARQSAKLPRIGDEAEHALADMKRLRASSKGRNT